MQAAISNLAFLDELDPSWPPTAHVRRGWDRLDNAGRKLVAERLAEALSRFQPSARPRPALRRFFSFLSQVEVIAIEVPLSALPSAPENLRLLFERQLADEVFHASVFAALARRLGGLDRPIPEAEKLLNRIREQKDPRTTAVLLNLIAEGWIENLFNHAVRWGVADDVFRMVLEDEARHVDEAMAHAEGMDLRVVEPAVREFELELFALVQHPRVILPTLAVAGEENFRLLSESFLAVHKSALAQVGLEPPEPVAELEKVVEDFQRAAAKHPQDVPRARRVEPETQWRRTALHLWDTPRNPTMYGWFDVRVDHLPRRLLTPAAVAVVGKVWAEYPRINRFTMGGELYEPATVNVGVRIALGEKGEALSTIVIPEADRRSIDDIRRILEFGVTRMNEISSYVDKVRVDPESEALSTILRDEELMRMVPPDAVTCPVTVSNVGRAGLHAGFGAMPGALGQSVELILGRVTKRPVWRGWRYKPTDVMTIGASADHRVIDGTHAAEATRRIEEGFSRASLREVFSRPNTIPPNRELARVALEEIGLTEDRMKVLVACKAPFWLGWLCWLFKK